MERSFSPATVGCRATRRSVYPRALVRTLGVPLKEEEVVGRAME